MVFWHVRFISRDKPNTNKKWKIYHVNIYQNFSFHCSLNRFSLTFFKFHLGDLFSLSLSTLFPLFTMCTHTWKFIWEHILSFLQNKIMLKVIIKSPVVAAAFFFSLSSSTPLLLAMSCAFILPSDKWKKSFFFRITLSCNGGFVVYLNPLELYLPLPSSIRIMDLFKMQSADV